jgi:hypothetical protein
LPVAVETWQLKRRVTLYLLNNKTIFYLGKERSMNRPMQKIKIFTKPQRRVGIVSSSVILCFILCAFSPALYARTKANEPQKSAFGLQDVIEKARVLASEPYQDPLSCSSFMPGSILTAP